MPKVKKIIFLLMLIFLSFLVTFKFLAKINNSKANPFDTYPGLKTGDILLWSNTSLDSLAIQELTDGSYSHAALLYKDSRKQTWALDTYPQQGLRYVKLNEYLAPKQFKLIRIALVRYKGKINTRRMEKWIKKLVQNKNNIVFDSDLIFDADELQIDKLDQISYRIYCSELIYKILRECASDKLNLYDNDYNRIMKKWETLSSRPKSKKASALDFIKLHYLKLNLKKLKDDRSNVLITPKGLLRSGTYKVIKEVEISKDLSDIKRLLRISEEAETQKTENR